MVVADTLCWCQFSPVLQKLNMPSAVFFAFLVKSSYSPQTSYIGQRSFQPPLNNQKPVNGLCVVPIFFLKEKDRNACLLMLNLGARRKMMMHLQQISQFPVNSSFRFSSSLYRWGGGIDHSTGSQSQFLETYKHSCILPRTVS